MIQTPTSDLVCELHNKPIVFGCTNQECAHERIGCYKCLQTKHTHHIEKVLELDGIKEGIEKCLRETDQIIKKIDNFIKQSHKALIKIKEKLLESKRIYTKFPELTKSEMNNVLEEVVNYSQQKTNERVTKYINQMQVYLNEGLSILIEDEQPIKKEQQNKIKIIEPIETKMNQLNQLIQKGKFTDALKLIDEILHLNPNNEDLWLQKAKILTGCGQFSEAILIYEQMLDTYPEHQQIQQNLGNIYLNQNNFDKALGLFEKLYQRNPTDFQIALNYGRCLKNQGKIPEAFTIFIQLDDSTKKPDPNVKYMLGECLLQIGDLSSAISYWKEAVLYGHEKKGQIQNLIQQYSKNV